MIIIQRMKNKMKAIQRSPFTINATCCEGGENEMSEVTTTKRVYESMDQDKQPHIL